MSQEEVWEKRWIKPIGEIGQARQAQGLKRRLQYDGREEDVSHVTSRIFFAMLVNFQWEGREWGLRDHQLDSIDSAEQAAAGPSSEECTLKCPGFL